ncbi:hypothetical protein SLS62_010046 [Diatrype stigma]|uniref:Uncharacterized protein n=1 Tax=Diatrype stigma TaxID=117547 RepID=A0AAN9UAM1_9PEZI
MKFSIVSCLLLGTLPSGLALPNDWNTTRVVEKEAAAPTWQNEPILHKRDEEWTMVLYNEHKNGGQCGGTSTPVSGNGGVCRNIVGKYCADLKVAVSTGIASCTFNFVKNGDCNSGTIESEQTVQAGKDSNGVDLSGDVQFVSVGCNSG